METFHDQGGSATPVSRLEKYRQAKHTQVSRPLLTLFASILVLSVLFGLGGLRLYCLSMEQKLSSLEHRITQAKELHLQQERELASLLSPARVYSYAHANLNMQRPSEILVVRIPSSPKQAEPCLASVPLPGETAWYNRLLNVFVRQASAHD